MAGGRPGVHGAVARAPRARGRPHGVSPGASAVQRRAQAAERHRALCEARRVGSPQVHPGQPLGCSQPRLIGRGRRKGVCKALSAGRLSSHDPRLPHLLHFSQTPLTGYTIDALSSMTAAPGHKRPPNPQNPVISQLICVPTGSVTPCNVISGCVSTSSRVCYAILWCHSWHLNDTPTETPFALGQVARRRDTNPTQLDAIARLQARRPAPAAATTQRHGGDHGAAAGPIFGSLGHSTPCLC